MKNKFNKLLSDSFIWKLLQASENITIEDSKEKAILLFNELDEKYRFHKNLSLLARTNKSNYKSANTAKY